MCGIIGISDAERVVLDLYQGLIALQHRGQDSAGIVTFDGLFHIKKGNGLVADIFNDKNVARLSGRSGIGHVRYPTVGSGSDEDAQPFFVNAPFGIALAHNGNVTNYHELRLDLADQGLRQLNSCSDGEAILNAFADELMKQDLRHFGPEQVFAAVAGVFRRVEGSYSCVAFIGRHGLVAFRDPYGIKPLIAGRRGRSVAFASESVAFDLLEFDVLRDVQPGEVFFVDAAGELHWRQLARATHRPCIFEYVYFARPDSVMDGIGVYDARLRLGARLAEECRRAGLEPDVVVAVPETGRAAAVELARTLGTPMREGLIKNRYIARTFIMSRQTARSLSVRQKLNPVASVCRGRRVLLVDDSIVRGTTSKEIVALVRHAGAREVYFAVTAPPLRYPCVYGIDMQTRGEFIAQNRPVDEIAARIGADRVVYQTEQGLEEAVRGDRSDMQFCTACFTRRYPTVLSDETMRRLEAERCQWNST